jgi:acyl phosphate:glycerol-3-phosphate acyltransferase
VLTALFVAIGYLSGSMPFGYWLPRVLKGIDIRRAGSGNIGATNVWRVLGRRYGVPVVLLDVAKGFVPTLLATIFVGHLAGALTGGAAMLGHARPLFLRFAKGGKAVATCGGAFWGLAPIVAAVGLAVWIVVFLAFRYASVASIVAAISLPIVAFAIGEPWPVIAFGSAAAVAVLVLHRANLKRLRAGTENRFQLRRRKDRRAPSSGAQPLA